MKKVKISVIVPVYNVEKYIDKCLNSLVNQTLKDIEIIVVNDGSTDNSQIIIDKYVKKYKNCYSYMKKNGGMSDARNYGIKHAKGEYIAFVDSDDYVYEDMYEKMYNKASSGNFDMVVCDLNYVYEDSDKIVRVDSGIKSDTTDVKSVMLNFYQVVWNKIFKASFFKDNFQFKKNVWFEDVEFLYRLLPHIKSIGVVKEPFNQYLQRKGSVTSIIDKRLYNGIDNWDGIIKYYEDNKFYEEYKLELEYCYVKYLYGTFIKRAAKYSYDDYKKAVDKVIKNVKNRFPKYRRNKYFYKGLKGIYFLIFNKSLSKLLYIVINKK